MEERLVASFKDGTIWYEVFRRMVSWEKSGNDGTPRIVALTLQFEVRPKL